VNWSLFAVQVLNSVQLGALLFLLSAGLTLVFGIMSFLNLAHGSLYMTGAYVGAVATARSGSFLVGVALALLFNLVLGLLIERAFLGKLYRCSHLDQVLCTFGLILIFNEIVRIIWGPSPMFVELPEALGATIRLFGQNYPLYRFLIIVAALAVAAGLYVLINRTRLGMLIRAGAFNAEMISVLGVNMRLLNTAVFAGGAALAGLAGILMGPLTAVQPGMGEPVLILTLVVIIVGGVGSIRGALYGALIVGVVDTVGRVYMQIGLREVFDRPIAQAVGPALASMLIYILMAIVLAVKPEGLFPVKHG